MELKLVLSPIPENDPLSKKFDPIWYHYDLMDESRKFPQWKVCHSRQITGDKWIVFLINPQSLIKVAELNSEELAIEFCKKHESMCKILKGLKK